MSYLDSLLADFAEDRAAREARWAEFAETVRAETAERARVLADAVEYTDEALDDLTSPDGGHFRGGYRARIVARGPRGKRYRDTLTATWRTPQQAADDGAKRGARLAGVMIMSVTVERVSR